MKERERRRRRDELGIENQGSEKAMGKSCVKRLSEKGEERERERRDVHIWQCLCVSGHFS